MCNDKISIVSTLGYIFIIYASPCAVVSALPHVQLLVLDISHPHHTRMEQTMLASS